MALEEGGIQRNEERDHNKINENRWENVLISNIHGIEREVGGKGRGKKGCGSRVKSSETVGHSAVFCMGMGGKEERKISRTVNPHL